MPELRSNFLSSSFVINLRCPASLLKVKKLKRRRVPQKRKTRNSIGNKCTIHVMQLKEGMNNFGLLIE